MNWETIKIRCSSLGCLFTEPQSKADKDCGELSKTAKSHLIKIYIQERWRRRKDVVTKYMGKGILCEEDALTLLSIVDNEFYVKNTERRENEFISGHADIVGDLIIDTKASWEPETFLPKLVEPLDKMYVCQLQGYMWLWDLPKAKLSYCLVSSPESIIQNERRRLLYSMDVVTDESPEYKIAVAELESNMIFDDIDPRERVISHIVSRDDDFIDKIPAKVAKAREFLCNFEKLHLKCVTL